jgi:purine-binding chemotaxis protein CheW
MQKPQSTEQGNGRIQDPAPVPAASAWGECSAEMVQQIWAERAARLAQVPPEHETGEQISLLLARLGRELYGLDARHVTRIEPVAHLTPVPRVPKWVAGVTNVRGRVLSVVDLAAFLGLPSPAGQQNGENGHRENLPPPSERYLVVVEAAGMELAFLVDGVLAVERLPSRQLVQAADMVRGLRPEYVRGIAERRRSSVQENSSRAIVIVLDLPNLLADERLIVHQEIV